MHKDRVLRILDRSHELVSSARVEGATVYNRAGDRLGTMHSVMINKRNGRVAYAVMTFDGLFGPQERVHPIPWPMLKYEPGREGYVVDLSREVLENAPSFGLGDDDRPREASDAAAINAYYGVPEDDGGEKAIELPIEEGDFNAQPV